MERLLQILRYTRRHGSEGERQFIKDILKPYKLTEYTNPKTGEVLAYVKTVKGPDNTSPPVLFCSHIDTVHGMNDDPIQEVIYDAGCEFAYKKDGKPLGADDGAGVWLLLEMIDAKVPGTYIFHRGEEVGGIGSDDMALFHTAWLKQFKWAIQFDRRGNADIITHMSCGKTCSVAFAAALADKLNDQCVDFRYAPSNMGIFTDTANYIDIIPECTNVSVGYDSEHTGQECLDVAHLIMLRDALIMAFLKGTGNLPVVRDPQAFEKSNYWDYTKTGFSTQTAYDEESVYIEPQDSQSVLAMEPKALRKWVKSATTDEITNLILNLADEVDYWADAYSVTMEKHEQQ